MTRAAFAIAAGAPTAWISNTTRLLGHPIPRTDASACAFALIRLLQTDFGFSLRNASQVARRAVHGPADALIELRRSRDGSATLILDMIRFHAAFNARLASARVYGAPAARGRRRTPPSNPVAAAAAFGVDIDLLRSNLLRTPARRLAMLEENAALVRELGKHR